MTARDDKSMDAEDERLMANITQIPMQVFKGESFAGPANLYFDS